MNISRRLLGGKSRGTILIVAMWIVLVLAGLALVLARSMRVEIAASANRVAAMQADWTARAALAAVVSEVDGTDGSPLSESVQGYEGVQVGNGYYWVLNPSLDEDTSYSFGIRDEASRVSLNSATSDVLLKLPGMTAEIAAAIVDWRDEDSEVSPGGAESEYYLLLDDPYYCKNASFETVEEVLLAKDTTTDFLFGEDANRNGFLDENENDAGETEPGDDRDGRLDRGVLDYLTAFSREPNVDADSEERINVNDVDATALSELLRSVVPESRYFQMMDRVRSGRPYQNVLDFHFRAELTSEEFAQLADRLTTSRDDVLNGLVNVNTAPRAVLLCLPDLEETDVDALVQRRQSPDTDLSSVAWVADVLDEEKAVAIGGLITARSFQFSADIVAASGNGRAFRRYRAVLDASASPPKLLLWKDLTDLGWPLDGEILESLRRGTFEEEQGATIVAGSGIL